MDNSICINHSIGNIPANDFKMMISDHYRENNMNGNDEILPQTAIKISIKGTILYLPAVIRSITMVIGNAWIEKE